VSRAGAAASRKPARPANGHGGWRPGAGRKPLSEKERAKRQASRLQARKAQEAVAALPKGGSNLSKLFRSLVQASQAAAARRVRRDDRNPFILQQAFPPRAVPKDKKLRMAMDSGLSWAANQWAGGVVNSVISEGLVFLGYPYLCELAQRPEYRVISETIADDATRKWIDFEIVGTREEVEEREEEDFEDPSGARGRREARVAAAGKDDKVKKIKDELERLELRDNIYNICRDDGFFGRSHLFLDFGDDLDNDGITELTTNVGDGRDETSKAKVNPGKPLKRIKKIEPIWTYPTTYNAINPLQDDWYNPQVWFVLGKQIHASRLLTFIGHPVPDFLKPVYAFGGLSLSQMAQPYVDIWLQTRQSVAQLVHSFSVMVLKTDLQTTVQDTSAADLINRVEAFNATRDNQGTFVVNNATEDFANVSTSLAGLHELQAQSQEHMMCLRGDTLVETDRGQVPIEKVTTRDRVMTRDGLAPVRWAGQTGMVSGLVEIRAGDSTLRATGWHPIWSETTRDFVNAENVDPSHRLLRSTNWENTDRQSLGAVANTRPIEVATVRTIEGPPEPVYNIEVADGHPPEFFANGILVHNSVVRIPATKFTGIQPSGLSTTSEGEMRAYYDTITAYQNRFIRPNLTKIMNFVQLSLFGEIDPEITFVFESLWEMSEKERAELQKIESERDQILIDGGVISPAEKREQVINDPHMPYGDLNPDDLPDLREEEEGGLIPENAGRATEGLLDAGPEAGEGGAGPPEGGGRGGGSGRGNGGEGAEAGDDGREGPRGLPWADQYEWMRGFDLPAQRADGSLIAKEPRGEAARKGLRVGSRVKFDRGGERGGGAGRVFGFVRGTNGAATLDGVAILDAENDRVAYVPAERVSARPVAEDMALDDYMGDAIGGVDPALAGKGPVERGPYRRPRLDAERAGTLIEWPPPPHAAMPPRGQPWRELDDGAADADWRENEHPRAPDGKFGKGGGAPPTSGKFKAPQLGLPHGPAGRRDDDLSIPDFLLRAPKPKPPLDPAKLKKVGAQMGSNPGGVFEDEDGERFYVKKGQTKDHVRNELTAAALYKLAGAKTLKYRDVEGGGHVATEMADLDKDNASMLSGEELARAKQDFAAHAWLGNYDAVGMGGDNVGMIDGQPVALDLGGALEYRARGAPKGKMFGDQVTELDTMRDPKIAPDAAAVFGDMTPAEMRESIQRVTRISDDDVRKVVKGLGGGDALAAKLVKRKADLALRAKTVGAEGDPAKAASTVVFPVGDALPIKGLNGVPFEAWEPPNDWSKVEGQNNAIDELEMDSLEAAAKRGKKIASGLIIREPDGRVWMVRPTGGFGGYQHSFPKGRLDEGLSLQANAIKEAWEESGLKARITGFAGDADGDLTATRYYFAERESGDPSRHQDETDGVVLAPPGKLAGFLNRERDLDLARKIVGDAAWEESKHPRDEGGKFASAPGSGEGSEKAFAKKLKKLGFGAFSFSAPAVAAKPKKTKFGGLWKETGAGAEADYDKNVESVLSKPAFPGQSYRQMLTFLIKESEKYGKPGQQQNLKLKTKLVEALYKAHEKANNAGQVAEAKKISEALGTIAAKDPNAFSAGSAAANVAVPVIMPGGSAEGMTMSDIAKYLPAFASEVDAINAAPGTNHEAKGWLKAKAAVNNGATLESLAASLSGAEKKAIIDKYGSVKNAYDLHGGYALKEQTSSPEAPAVKQAVEQATFQQMPAPTAEEMAKAKKSVALQMQYVPGGTDLQYPQTQKEAQKLVEAFNEKYAGKEMTNKAALTQKVNDFKMLSAKVAALKVVEQQKAGELATQAKAAQQKQAKAAAEAAKKAKAEALAKNAHVMKELGITESEADGFNALVQMVGGKQADVVAQFKHYESQAKDLGYPITGFQTALIKNYTNGGYSATNSALRSGSWTTAQHVYVKMVNKALQAMPTYAGTVQRGTSLDSGDQALYKVGHVVEERAFTSTSISKPWGGNTKFTIKAIGKRGAHVKKLSHYPGEDEVIFSARTFFKVTKVEGTPGSKMHVYMEEMEE
jgi:ADP-ribose pyrophosphatase YjhB (NUDIX family)